MEGSCWGERERRIDGVLSGLQSLEFYGELVSLGPISARGLGYINLVIYTAQAGLILNTSLLEMHSSIHLALAVVPQLQVGSRSRTDSGVGSGPCRCGPCVAEDRSDINRQLRRQECGGGEYLKCPSHSLLLHKPQSDNGCKDRYANCPASGALIR